MPDEREDPMKRNHAEPEIVHVIKPFRLVDSESYERAYWRPDDRPLDPGYYVVTWPRRAEPGRFDERASFRGPFPARSAALAALGRGHPTHQ
jgi:hypothetical protein